MSAYLKTPAPLFSFLTVCVLSISAIFSPATAETRNLKSALARTLYASQKEYKFPGVTAAIVLPNKELITVACGIADVRTNTRMTTESRMLAASIGKTFVAATVLALVHEKRIDLDSPVSNWLGDRAWFTRLPNHRTITIRHLLNHSSGLPDHVNDPVFRRVASKPSKGVKNPLPPSKLVSFILDQPPLFEAGQGWAYTDTGFILLGMIIESVSAQDYFKVIQTRFIVPLKLEHTSPSNRKHLPGLATGYTTSDNAFGYPAQTTISLGVMAWNPIIEWTGGGLLSSSRDLAVWGAALFEGRAMDHPYLHELLTGVLINPLQAEVSYGLGVAIYRGGPFGPVYGHGGWIPGYSSSLRYYPKYGVSIAFQINTDIGVIDHSSTLVQELEHKLAKLVMHSLKQ